MLCGHSSAAGSNHQRHLNTGLYCTCVLVAAVQKQGSDSMSKCVAGTLNTPLERCDAHCMQLLVVTAQLLARRNEYESRHRYA
jgi:hypothetical protein